MVMVNDSFYREMSDAQIHAAYKLAKENIEDGFLAAGMKGEVEMMHAIAKERDMVLDDSLSSKIQAATGFIEFAVEKHTRGGKREGAGRKATGITKKASITLSDDVWEQIEAEKAEKGLSQSAILREIIESYYNK